MPPFLLFFLAVILALVAWMGGPPERWGAAFVFIRHVLVDPAYHAFSEPSRFDALEPVHAVLDTSLFLAILWLALHANRIWPMWLCASALIVLVGHFVVLMGMKGNQLAYWGMTQLPIFMELGILLAGTISHRLRLRRTGPYRSWRLS